MKEKIIQVFRFMIQESVNYDHNSITWHYMECCSTYDKECRQRKGSTKNSAIEKIATTLILIMVSD